MLINHGDSLSRTGREGEAGATYALGASAGLFGRADQRPVHEVRKAAALDQRPPAGTEPAAGVKEQKERAGAPPSAPAPLEAKLLAKPVWRHKGLPPASSSPAVADRVVEAVAAALEGAFGDVRAEALALLGDRTGSEATTAASASGAVSSHGVAAAALALADHATGGRLLSLQNFLLGGLGDALGGSGGEQPLRRGHAPGFFPANDMLLRPGSGPLSPTWFGAKVGHGLPGVWSQFFLFEHGLKDHANCALAPRACALAEALGAANCSLGDAKLSLMAPGTEVKRRFLPPPHPPL
jgi:hypothetical protein